MNNHLCVFVSTADNNTFECNTCKSTHVCTETQCDSIELNRDRTYVCTVTGRCFNQMVCYTFDPHYEPSKFLNKVTKKTQQTKNSKLTVLEIEDIIKKLNFTYDGYDIHELIRQIFMLWHEIMENRLLDYVRRNDKFAVVIATLFSLNSGLCNSCQVYIVHPSDKSTLRLNKKKKITNGVQIKLIRYGQRLLRRAFKDREVVENSIKI